MIRSPHSLRHSPLSVQRRTAGFSVMEVLVVVAILLVIIVIGYPLFRHIRAKQNGTVALERMQALARGVTTYANQNDGALPREDATGGDTWENTAKPESKDAWYNSVLTLIGKKPVGEFVHSPRSFYEKDNYLFLPGAEYPENEKKMKAPLFAIAFNTKLERKDASGEKRRTKTTDITSPSKTVIFLEQGLPGEPRTLQVQTKNDYDGSPKGSAKSFVGRYGKKGVLAFLDGRAELVDVKEVLTETGDFPYPQTEFVWTPNPDDNPNKKDDQPKKEEKHKKQ